MKVRSHLNSHRWRHLLRDYKFSRVCNYIEFSFPQVLDYNHLKYNTSVSNLTSAQAFPKAIDEYLNTERSLDAITDPFDTPPFPALHVSPMMTHPKSDGSCRVIVDLSWLHGNRVNDWIPDDVSDDVDCVLHYPSIDHILERIAAVGANALLFKIDLK